MSTFYTETEDSTSQFSDAEPRLCFDTDCSFPPSPTYQSSSFHTGLHELSRSKIPPKCRTSEWAEEVLLNVQNHVRNPIGPVFVGGADERGTKVNQRVEEEDSISRVTERETDCVNQISCQRETDDSTAPSPSSYVLSGMLDKWLSEVFSHTLQGQLQGDAFTGGAEDQDLTASDCPLCFSPIGDPCDQHLLRCKYAHEEQEKMKVLVTHRKQSTDPKA